tara:strand:+ start:1286 stop:1828 length:543 start_codon:yes stop_codon:yes gene_type:complete
MLPLETLAPDFKLINCIDQQAWSLSQQTNNQAVVVIFMCNHCPYVVHIIEGLVRCANDYMDQGIAFVAINANDVMQYPDDSPEKMTVFAQQYGIPFPYCFDEAQAVAKAYQAACTPDLFVFDERHQCVYRGRFDNSTPGNGQPVTGVDLRQALDRVLSGQPYLEVQLPSMGCNIKWRDTP